MVALSVSRAFLGRPNNATILQPVVSMGRSLNMRKRPPPELFEGLFSRVVCWRRDIKAGFSIWWNGLEWTGGIVEKEFCVKGFELGEVGRWV